MARGKINGGVCGFVTFVQADAVGNGKIALRITTDCPNIQKIAEELVQIDSYDAVFGKELSSNKVYQLMSKHCPHPSCIVGAGILKAIEVAAGLALPQEASIKVER